MGQTCPPRTKHIKHATSMPNQSKNIGIHISRRRPRLQCPSLSTPRMENPRFRRPGHTSIVGPARSRRVLHWARNEQLPVYNMLDPFHRRTPYDRHCHVLPPPAITYRHIQRQRKWSTTQQGPSARHSRQWQQTTRCIANMERTQGYNNCAI